MEKLIREAVVKMRANRIDCIADMHRSYVHGVLDAYLTLPVCDLDLVQWALEEVERDRMDRKVKAGGVI